MKIAIIGGAGKMGRWLASTLHNDGKQVIITGRDQQKLKETGRQLGVPVASNGEAVKEADVVILSVPIDSFEPIVNEIVPYITPAHIVIDVTSVKAMPVAIMRKHLKTKHILGAHPLFGPGAKSFASQNIVLTPTSSDESALAQRVQAYLESKGARVSLMTPQEHDAKMTLVLGLAHFIAIVTADTLLSAPGFKAGESLGGITYKVLLTLVESVLTEDPELYAAIQMNLSDLAVLEQSFKQKAGQWAELVVKGDREEFVRRMNGLKEKLKQDNPNFGKAYELMYRIAEWR